MGVFLVKWRNLSGFMRDFLDLIYASWHDGLALGRCHNLKAKNAWRFVCVLQQDFHSTSLLDQNFCLLLVTSVLHNRIDD
ncbi:MAG: hypothetical protein CL920_25075 [Deltaproteobacteria bacterium]|nr:hypothetical protein [Deltaproteobacteria bacterium]MBU51978.1 hypothetical protein [Deltaproteobacteria bacterium]